MCMHSVCINKYLLESLAGEEVEGKEEPQVKKAPPETWRGGVRGIRCLLCNRERNAGPVDALTGVEH